jgi:cytochrome b6-f complex iron-sulfur subunit
VSDRENAGSPRRASALNENQIAERGASARRHDGRECPDCSSGAPHGRDRNFNRGCRGMAEEGRPVRETVLDHRRQPTSRREFCVRTCQTVSLLTISTLLPGCGGSPTSPSAPALPTASGTLVNGAIAVTVDSASPLASVGGAALVQAAGQNVLVARTAQDAFTAVTAVCTHEGCTVNGFASQAYVCPCHGSRFSTSGAVLQGPASSPLRQFPTAFAGNVLTIDI